MNYRNTLIAAAAAVIVPLTGTALANDGHDKTGKAGANFDALDTNRDGRISRTEASADAKIVFAQADANGDGYIDNMEFAKAKKMGDSTTSPEPQSLPQPSEPVTPDATMPPADTTTPPSDTETPRQ